MNTYFKKCLICENTNFKQVYPKSYDNLVKCCKCDFIFFLVTPTKSQLIKHYETYPRTDDISEITIKRYRELLSEFQSAKLTNKILDVGCGNGHFLKQAKIHNWNCFGTEFTDVAVDICRKKGLIIHQGELDISNYNLESFDVIVFIEVIEHINNPIEELLKFKSLLRKGGLLYITTPNFNSFESRFLKDKWRCVEFPEHLSYYTPKTLDFTLSKVGFKKKKIFTSGLNVGIFTKKSMKTSNNNENYRELAENKILFSYLKKIANFTLNVTGMGDTIKAIYQKI